MNLDNIVDLNNFLKVYFKNNNLELGGVALQNVAYKLKMELGESYHFFKDLPFYWYSEGSFCEPLSKVYNSCLSVDLMLMIVF